MSVSGKSADDVDGSLSGSNDEDSSTDSNESDDREEDNKQDKDQEIEDNLDKDVAEIEDKQNESSDSLNRDNSRSTFVELIGERQFDTATFSLNDDVYVDEMKSVMVGNLKIFFTVAIISHDAVLINGDEFDSIGYFYAMSIFPSDSKQLTTSDISLHYLTTDFKKCVTKTLDQVLTDGNVFATRKLIKDTSLYIKSFMGSTVVVTHLKAFGRSACTTGTDRQLRQRNNEISYTGIPALANLFVASTADLKATKTRGGKTKSTVVKTKPKTKAKTGLKSSAKAGAKVGQLRSTRGKNSVTAGNIKMSYDEKADYDDSFDYNEPLPAVMQSSSLKTSLPVFNDRTYEYSNTKYSYGGSNQKATSYQSRADEDEYERQKKLKDLQAEWELQKLRNEINRTKLKAESEQDLEAAMQASIREDDRINHERRLKHLSNKRHLDALHNDSMSQLVMNTMQEEERLARIRAKASQVALLTAMQKKSSEEEASLAQMFNM